MNEASAPVEPDAKVLLVDDEPHILTSLRRLLRTEGYSLRTAEGGEAALALLEEEPADVVVSDMRMPGMDGTALLKEVLKRWPDTTRIILTGYADINATMGAVNEGGVHRYLTKPWNDEELKLAVRDGLARKRLVDERNRLLVLTERQNQELVFLNEGLEDAVRARTAELRQTASFLELSNKKLKDQFLETLRVFANLIELRQKNLGGHAKRVADLARRVAAKMGLGEQEVHDITVAGLLHDIGKIGWSDDLLSVPFNGMKGDELGAAVRHPVVAETALAELENLRAAAKMIRHHHERFDGRGYPDQLSGLVIPMGARILAVVNDFDALQVGSLSERRYSRVDAVKAIRDGRGVRYDPMVVDAFLDLLGEGQKAAPAQPGETGGVHVEVHKLKPGMRLARNVFDHDSTLLLSRGYVLDDMLIGQLRNYQNISGRQLEVYVELPPPAPAG